MIVTYLVFQTDFHTFRLYVGSFASMSEAWDAIDASDEEYDRVEFESRIG